MTPPEFQSITLILKVFARYDEHEKRYTSANIYISLHISLYAHSFKNEMGKQIIIAVAQNGVNIAVETKN